MRKLFLLPAGALLLAGCDFSGGSDAVTAPIARIQITDVAVSMDEDGSNQDVFFEIQNAAGRSFYRSPVQTDADLTDGASAVIDGSVEIPSTASQMQIAFYDADGTQLADADRLALSETFTIADLQAAADGQVSIGAQDRSPSREARFTVVRSGQ